MDESEKYNITRVGRFEIRWPKEASGLDPDDVVVVGDTLQIMQSCAPGVGPLLFLLNPLPLKDGEDTRWPRNDDSKDMFVLGLDQAKELRDLLNVLFVELGE